MSGGSPRRFRAAMAMSLLALTLSACRGDESPAASETVATGPLVLSVRSEGELRATKSTPLTVPGRNWSSRQLEWMLPEGSVVKQGDLLARFSSLEGEQQLSQALIELQRNALARAAKEGDLDAAEGRVVMDLSHVATQLGIAQRYVDADLSAIARNEMLDAVEDVEFLQSKQDTLEWQRGQSGARGGAELAVLDAQRATQQISAKTRQADLDALELRAPSDGVLLLSTDWSGDKPMVGANLRAGFDYGSLPDTAAMEIQIDLPQIEAQGVQVGAEVEMHPLGRPDQKIRGKLSWVASAAKVKDRESPVKYLSMRASVPADAVARYRLVPGQRFDARVFLIRAEDALSVPNVAIEQREGGDYVQVREGGRFVPRAVKLGVRGTARSQVLEGLREGEEVLLSVGGKTAPASDSDAAQKDTPQSASDDVKGAS